MKKEVENFCSKLLTRVVRRPNSSCDKPALIASFDLPVAKRTKVSTIDAFVNDGLHVHAILLIPPKSRLRVPLAEHIESNHEVYLRDRWKLDRVDVQPFYTEESSRVVDYVMKSIKKGRLDYDDSVLILPRSSSECRDDFCQRERGVEGRRKSSMRSKKGRP